MKNLLLMFVLIIVMSINVSLTAYGAPLFAQEAEQAIPVAQLREDLRVMRGALEESHVGLYWFISKPELARRFEIISANLVRPMTAREFHRQLLPLVASLRHGHTGLTLPVQGVGYRLRHLSKEGKYFPFEVRVLKDKLYVVSDLSQEANVAPGAEIVAVNGQSATELISKMRLYLSADGANDTFKMFQLGQGFQFHSLLDLLYGPSDTYKLDVLPISGKAKSRRVVSALSPDRLAVLYRERTGREIDKYPPGLGFRLLGDKVALLTVGSFYEGLFQSKEPDFFKAFMTSAFRQIKDSGVEDLIIDVRKNEGGNGDYVPLLYSFLADKPFRMVGPTVLASASMSFLRYAENPDDEVKAFAAAPGNFVASQAADGAWVLKEEFARYPVYEPQPDRFTGRLYVLTDGGSFSATNGFLDLVYRYHRMEKRSVQFVGEQNGGDNSFGRASGGKALVITLPNSKQRLSIPLLGASQHFASNVPKAVIPDHRISPAIQDVIGGIDRELLFARELIARQRLQKVRGGR
jgi:C-terminal processing protease CtpA/Prc